MRLYKEYEPLIFQLHELSESALFRIMGVAEDIRSCPFFGNGDYYTKRTVYRILAPMIVFKQMSRRLTLFDLSLNPYFKIQYILSKILYHTLDKDIELSNLYPKIVYDPRSKSLPKQNRQGIVIGVIDNMIENLITFDTHDNIYRLLSFGEFEKKLLDKDYFEYYKEIFILFNNFHPNKDSVLWRILITQALLYKVILHTSEKKLDINNTFFEGLLQDKEKFDWRTTDEKDKMIPYDNHFEAAIKYIAKHLQIYNR